MQQELWISIDPGIVTGAISIINSRTNEVLFHRDTQWFQSMKSLNKIKRKKYCFIARKFISLLREENGILEKFPLINKGVIEKNKIDKTSELCGIYTGVLTCFYPRCDIFYVDPRYVSRHFFPNQINSRREKKLKTKEIIKINFSLSKISFDVADTLLNYVYCLDLKYK